MYCKHEKLSFDDNDYFIVCKDCGKRWVLIGRGTPATGKDSFGKVIGGRRDLIDKNFK